MQCFVVYSIEIRIYYISHYYICLWFDEYDEDIFRMIAYVLKHEGDGDGERVAVQVFKTWYNY